MNFIIENARWLLATALLYFSSCFGQTFFISLFAGLIVLIGVYLVTYAFQNSKNHFSSIFALFYLQILWSLLIGIIFFNEYLNFIALIGAVLIVLSGILSLQAQKKQLKDL